MDEWLHPTVLSGCSHQSQPTCNHDDVIKWKHFPRNWPFVRGIHRSPVNSPHKDQWRGALMFSLICVWINGWVNNREAGDLRRYRAHYCVIVMIRLRLILISAYRPMIMAISFLHPWSKKLPTCHTVTMWTIVVIWKRWLEITFQVWPYVVSLSSSVVCRIRFPCVRLDVLFYSVT